MLHNVKTIHVGERYITCAEAELNWAYLHVLHDLVQLVKLYQKLDDRTEKMYGILKKMFYAQKDRQSRQGCASEIEREQG